MEKFEQLRYNEFSVFHEKIHLGWEGADRISAHGDFIKAKMYGK